ncbi:MAG: hypothetical protein ACLQJR_32770 [Stellaceae bacterium]
MQNIRDDGAKPSRVTAFFGHSTLTLTLSKGATLADLADRLAHPGRLHQGTPVAIGVKFAARRSDEAPSHDLQPWSGPSPWPRRARP